MSFFSNILMPLENLMTWIMQACYDFSGSYGIAIVLLTLAIRVCLLPLTYKQTVSMREMQRLQPKLKELQEKYKNDTPRLQQETMQLYKENNINPMGGCLPLLVQMPFLIALYRMLYTYEGFNGEAFLWVSNLQAPDIALVVLLGATTFLSQKVAMTDPKQMKMFAFMPILMMVMFWKLPAGVVLYIVVSNLFTIVQTYILMRKLPPVENQ